MFIRILISVILLLAASQAMAVSVKTLMEAAVCPQPSDFSGYYVLEGKGHDIQLKQLPPECKKINTGTALTVAGSAEGDVIEVSGKKHAFFQVNAPDNSIVKMWIPAQMVSKPSQP